MGDAFAFWSGVFQAWVPTLHQFFHGGNINTAVMKPVLNVWHVLREKCAICTNGVSAQRNFHRFRAVHLDEVERLLHGIFVGNGGRLDEV